MAGIRRFLEAVMKKEGDEEHSADHYLVVEDPEKTTTWHLRVKGPDGKLDHRLMGAAWAALHGGYRGNKYEGPDKQKGLAKLKKMYEDEDMSMPGSKEAQSLSKQLMLIDDAFRAKYRMPEPAMVSSAICYLVETSDDYVIARMEDKYFKVTYQLEGDEIVFAERGEWEEVEEQKDWVAKAEEAKRQQRTHEFREVEIAPKKNGK